MRNEKTKRELPLSAKHRKRYVQLIDLLLSVLILIAPYYWLPAIQVGIWSKFRDFMAISLFIAFAFFLVRKDGRIILPDRRLSLLLLALPVALLPGLVRVNTFSGIMRYFNYISFIPFFAVYATIVRQKGIRAIQRYRDYVIIAMIPQILYVSLAAFGIITPIDMPTIFGNTIEPYGAGFSAVQTQFSISIAIIVPLSAGYIAKAYEDNDHRKILWSVIFIPIVIAFAGSHGRSGILAGFVGMITFTILYKRKWALYLLFSLCIASLSLIWVFTDTVLEFMKLGSTVNSFTSNRLALFSKGIELFANAPVIGIGFGNRPFTIDNLYLVTIIESGFLPGVLVVIFVGLTVVSGHWVVRQFAGTEDEILTSSLFAAVVSYLPITIFEQAVIFLNFFLNIGWWVCLGSLLMLPILRGNIDD